MAITSSLSSFEIGALGGLGSTFIRLFPHAIEHRLVDEADDLVAGIALIYPHDDMTEMRVNVMYARQDYVGAEALLHDSTSQWAMAWRALFAKRRNDANWRDLAEEAVEGGSPWAKLLLEVPAGRNSQTVWKNE